MKKILFFCLAGVTALLVACSSENENTNTTKETEKNSQPKIEQQMNAQYYSVLHDAVNSFGYPTDSKRGNQNEYESGVQHAELIDFNNDGVEELYILLKNGGYTTTDYEHRNVAAYVNEVWTYNEEADQPILAFSAPLTTEECGSTNCDFSTSFVEDSEGRTSIKQHLMAIGHGAGNESYKFVSLNEGETAFTVTNLSENTIPVGIEYYKDEALIDEQAFEQELQKYTMNEKILLAKATDSSTVGFGPSSSTTVSQVLQHLGEHNNTALVGDSVENTAVLKELQKFEHNIFIDVFDEEQRMSLVFDLLMSEEVASTFDDATFRTKYAFADVAESYKNRYGTELSMDGVINNPESIITFEDNAFYVVGTEYYVHFIDRNVEKMVAVSDQVYYLHLIDKEFDSYNYHSAEGTPPLLEIDFATLPPEADNFMTTNINRYAVVKMVDGEPKLQYLGYRNLTDDELAAF